MKRLGFGTQAVVVATGVLAATLGFASSSDANAPPVTIGKISGRALTSAARRREFKRAVEQQLAHMHFSGKRQHYVLSPALARLNTVVRTDHVESTCTVNATLTQRRGTLRAVFRGQARAIDGRDAARSAELAALQGAVRSAIRGLPQAMR